MSFFFFAGGVVNDMAHGALKSCRPRFSELSERGGCGGGQRGFFNALY